jgi:hypothetical protein
MNLSSGFDPKEAKVFYAKYWGGAPTPEVIYSNARNATVQRGHVYSANLGVGAKEKLWSDYRAYVEKKLDRYQVGKVDDI